jgi:hippurate hydrolase
MKERVTRIAGQIAQAYRCTAEVDYLEMTPVLVNHDDSVAHVERTIDALLGADKRSEAAPTMAGEDFSLYLQQVPGCFFWLGSGPAEGAEKAYGLHHPKFRIEESCLPLGASLLAAIALNRLNGD